MNWTSARLLREGECLISQHRVLKIQKVEYAVPQVKLVAIGTDNVTGEVASAPLDWDQQCLVMETHKQEIEGAHGHSGHLEIEPAAPPKGMGDKWTYRWRVHNEDGELIGEGADLEGSALEVEPHVDRAMESLFSFLLAAAEAERYGPDSENRDLFNDRVRRWAHDCSTELEIAASMHEREQGTGIEL